MIIWAAKIFLYSSSVYSCHLFLISSASVRSIPFLSFIEPIFGCKEYNRSDFGVDHLVLSMCRGFSCVVGRGCLLRPVSYAKITLALTSVPCNPRNSQKSSPGPQFKSNNSLVLSLLYGPTLTSIHNYWKNQSFEYMDLCWQK